MSTDLCLFLFTPILAYAVWKGLNIVETYMTFQMKMEEHVYQEKIQSIQSVLQIFQISASHIMTIYRNFMNRMNPPTRPSNIYDFVFRSRHDRPLEPLPEDPVEEPTECPAEDSTEDKEDNSLPPLERDNLETSPLVSSLSKMSMKQKTK